MESHVKIIGVLWIVFGALGLFAALTVFGVLFGISFIPDMGVEAPVILRAVAIGVILFMTILFIPQIIGGVWLIKKQEWARILVIAIAFLSLINFPFGTALGIYSLVVLFKEETVQLFKT